MRDPLVGLFGSVLSVLRGQPRRRADRPGKAKRHFRPALEPLEARLPLAVATAVNQFFSVLPSPMVKEFRPEFTDPDGPTT